MNTLEIMNYEGHTFNTGVPINNIKFIDVTVISGDEIVNIYCEDGTKFNFDSADFAKNPMVYNFYDGSYSVPNCDLEDWSLRESTYDTDRWCNIG